MRIDGATFKSQIMEIALIGRASLSNDATVDFNNIGDFDQYVLVWTDVRAQTDGAELQLRVSHDNGATFISGAADYKWSNRLSTEFGDSDTSDLNDTEINLQTSNSVHQMGTAIGETYSGEAWFHGMGANQTYAGGVIHGGGRAHFPSTSNQFGFFQYVAATNGLLPPTRINAFRLFADTGNLVSGHVYLYGIRI